MRRRMVWIVGLVLLAVSGVSQADEGLVATIGPSGDTVDLGQRSGDRAVVDHLPLHRAGGPRRPRRDHDHADEDRRAHAALGLQGAQRRYRRAGHRGQGDARLRAHQRGRHAQLRGHPRGQLELDEAG